MSNRNTARGPAKAILNSAVVQLIPCIDCYTYIGTALQTSVDCGFETVKDKELEPDTNGYET